MPFSKMLTFYKSDAFSVTAQYVSDVPIPDKQIGVFDISKKLRTSFLCVCSMCCAYGFPLIISAFMHFSPRYQSLSLNLVPAVWRSRSLLTLPTPDPAPVTPTNQNNFNHRNVVFTNLQFFVSSLERTIIILKYV